MNKRNKTLFSRICQNDFEYNRSIYSSFEEIRLTLLGLKLGYHFHKIIPIKCKVGLIIPLTAPPPPLSTLSLPPLVGTDYLPLIISELSTCSKLS